MEPGSPADGTVGWAIILLNKMNGIKSLASHACFKTFVTELSEKFAILFCLFISIGNNELGLE